MKLYFPISTNWCTADTPEMMARSSTVTCPASCVAFEMMTPSPTWQSCARCTYDMMKQFRPMVVFIDSDVPRLIVEYSRITLPSPTSTVVSSPLNLRSCGSPPSTEPTPTRTFRARRTLRSSTACGAIVQPSPTTQPSPTIAYAPTLTPDPSSASGAMMALECTP